MGTFCAGFLAVSFVEVDHVRHLVSEAAHDCVGLHRPKLIHAREAQCTVFLEKIAGPIDVVIDPVAIAIPVPLAILFGTEAALPLVSRHRPAVPLACVLEPALFALVAPELALVRAHGHEVIDAGVRRRMLHHDGFEIDLLEFVASRLDFLIRRRFRPPIVVVAVAVIIPFVIVPIIVIVGIVELVVPTPLIGMIEIVHGVVAAALPESVAHTFPPKKTQKAVYLPLYHILYVYVNSLQTL